MITARVAKFETLGMLDGPGVRMVVFLQGCILRCAYCHNPALLDFKGGTEYTPQQLLNKILRYKNYFNHGGGVTVSGGEPLCHTEFLIEFFALCKQQGIHTCLDTSGVGFGNFDKLLEYTDLVILDIKHTNQAQFEKLTLVAKQKTEAFHTALIASKKDIWIRQVIVPDITDSEEYLPSLLQEILKFEHIQKIEFLPFHTMAESVYEELNMPYRLKGTMAMDNAQAMLLQEKFIKMYCQVRPSYCQNKTDSI